MFRFFTRRISGLIVTFAIITVISFGIIHLAPGSPAEMGALNPQISKAQIDKINRLYGLNQPIFKQYINWIKNLAHANFGVSLVDGRPVSEKILERIPITVTINLISMLLILAAGIPIGILMAATESKLPDKLLTFFVFIGYATPGFWLALLLMLFFGVNLHILPIAGLHSIGADKLSALGYFADEAKHLVLPIFVSAFGGLAGISRYVRGEMITEFSRGYIKYLDARGMSKTSIIKHAARNSLLPIITILGLSVPGLIGGSVIFETIFAIPGMGQLFYQSAMARDYPVILGILVIGAILTLLGNLIADLAYGLADPRTRTEAAS